MASEQRIIREGVYNNDYFSGAQVAIYIGDVLVDEITTMSLAVSQSKAPLYGYASMLFDGVSKGNVIVQGEFSINFKEAGYLWLILNRYRAMVKAQNAGIFLDENLSPFYKGKGTGEYTVDKTIEQLTNGDLELTPKYLNQINELAARAAREDGIKAVGTGAKISQGRRLLNTQAGLAGFSSEQRAVKRKGSLGQAESVFEAFENYVWGRAPGRGSSAALEALRIPDIGANRRADEPALNPFDIYIAFGDYVDDDRIHHTVQRVSDVHLTGQSKQIVIDGQPIQESYSFFARDLI